MIGRVSDRRMTSLKPAFLKAANKPVEEKTGGQGFLLGSMGYPSIILPSLSLTNSIAASNSLTVNPLFL
jgi:hypothetical protein